MRYDIPKILGLFLLGVILLVGRSYAQSSESTSEDARFLSELSDRGLFRLAESFCMNQLKEDVSSRVKAELSKELVRILGDQSLSAVGEQRENLWSRAEKVVTDFQREFPENQFGIFVDYQLGLGYIARGELFLMEAQFLQDNTGKIDLARIQLRKASNLFRDLDARLEKISAQSSTALPGIKPKNVENYLSLGQQIHLRNYIQVIIAKTLLILAETYPEESEDRLNFLLQSQETIKTLWGLPDNSTLAWEVRMEELACLRLKGKEYSDEYKKRLSTFKSRDISNSIREKLLIEELQFLLADQNAETALTTARTQIAPSQLGINPELDLILLDIILGMLETASSRDEPRKSENIKVWHEEAQKMVNLIREKHSPLWVRRAEIRLGKMLNRQQITSDDFNMIVLRAENACRTGDLQSALLACETVWHKASDTAQKKIAQRLAVMVAALAYKNQDKMNAMTWYQRTGMILPDDADAEKYHKYAVYLASQLAQEALSGKDVGADKMLDQYAMLLDEHLEKWSRSSDSVQMENQRVQLAKLRGKTDYAVRLLQQRTSRMDPQDPDFKKQVNATLNAWDDYLKQLMHREKKEMISSETENPDSLLHNKIVSEKEAVHHQNSALIQETLRAITWAERMSEKPALNQPALKAALWRLTYLPSSAPDAQRLMEKYILNHPTESSDLIQAQSLLVLAIITQGRDVEARNVIKNLRLSADGVNNQDTASALLAILKTLNALRKNASETQIKRYTELELEVFTLLKPMRNMLPPDTQTWLERVEARALDDAGRFSEALLLYQRMALKYPHNREIQTAMALILIKNGRVDEALSQWRTVEKRSKVNSHEWWEAKYYIASLLFQKEDISGAKKMIGILKALYPEMGGKEWNDKFNKLESEKGNN